MTERPLTSPSRHRRGYVWLLRRAGFGVATLFVVSVIVFVATQALPSNPAKAILGREATPERVAQLRAELSLDRPPLDQYFHWLGGLVTGDVGTSLASRVPVSDLLGDRIVNTFALLLLASVIALSLALVIGSATALRRDSPLDHLTLVVMLIMTALPEFVVGIALVILFGTTVLTILPAVALFPVGESPFAHLTALVLPVATLVLVSVPYLSRLARASLIDVLESEYVEMARLKGLSERRVLWRHALPNALVPPIQGSAVMLAYLAGGIVVIEYLFQYPGLGTLLVNAIASRDLPVIQATVLTLAAFYIVVNLAADLLSVLVSPRVRTAGR